MLMFANESDVAMWGSVADWVSGLATAAALGFAFAGWRIAKQEQHAAAAAKREQDARDRAAHARQFVCWAGTSSSTTAADGQFKFGSNVYVLNNSAHPFLNVSVFATASGPGGWTEEGVVRWARVLPTPDAVAQQQDVAILHPDTGERPLVMPRWTVHATFTDVNGVQWLYAEDRLQTFEDAVVPVPGEEVPPQSRRRRA